MNELGSSKLRLIGLDGAVIIDNIGSYDSAKGSVTLSSLFIDQSSYLSETGIKISATPSNQSTISPLRNYIIVLDSDFSSTVGLVDTGETRVTL
jgi:hypothetical protein